MAKRNNPFDSGIIEEARKNSLHYPVRALEVGCEYSFFIFTPVGNGRRLDADELKMFDSLNDYNHQQKNSIGTRTLFCSFDDSSSRAIVEWAKRGVNLEKEAKDKAIAAEKKKEELRERKRKERRLAKLRRLQNNES